MCRVVQVRDSSIIVKTVNGGYLVETFASNLVPASDCERKRGD